MTISDTVVVIVVASEKNHTSDDFFVAVCYRWKQSRFRQKIFEISLFAGSGYTVFLNNGYTMAEPIKIALF
ncbi:MAG: hypothetical protein LBJ67_17355 [Planctomycetaceae bacterium]|nr:hypothetical protein [Planctomycetaceae bacterium]